MEEVVLALRAQCMSEKAIAAQVGCSQSTISRILQKDLSAPVNSGGRPKKTSPQDDHALKRITLSNRFKSTTSITHPWNETLTSPVSRSTTYRRLRYVSCFIKPDTLHQASTIIQTKEKTSTVRTEVL